MITSTWKTAPAAALDAEIHILPMEIKLKEELYVQLIRIKASPAWEQIAAIRSNSNVTTNRQSLEDFQSPLEMLEIRFRAVFEKDLSRLETRLSFVRYYSELAPVI